MGSSKARAVEAQRKSILEFIRQNLSTEEIASRVGMIPSDLEKRHLVPLSIEGKCHSRKYWFLGKKDKSIKKNHENHRN